MAKLNLNAFLPSEEVFSALSEEQKVAVRQVAIQSYRKARDAKVLNANIERKQKQIVSFNKKISGQRVIIANAEKVIGSSKNPVAVANATSRKIIAEAQVAVLNKGLDRSVKVLGNAEKKIKA